MKRTDLLPYVSFYCNDAGDAGRLPENPETGFCEVPDHAHIVAWQCGFEPLAVAVWSYIPGVRLEEQEAVELATEYLQEKKWFSDNDNPPDPDYVI